MPDAMAFSVSRLFGSTTAGDGEGAMVGDGNGLTSDDVGSGMSVARGGTVGTRFGVESGDAIVAAGTGSVLCAVVSVTSTVRVGDGAVGCGNAAINSSRGSVR